MYCKTKLGKRFDCFQEKGRSFKTVFQKEFIKLRKNYLFYQENISYPRWVLWQEDPNDVFSETHRTKKKRIRCYIFRESGLLRYKKSPEKRKSFGIAFISLKTEREKLNLRNDLETLGHN